MHRPKAKDGLSIQIYGLAAGGRPHLKALDLNKSYLAPEHGTLQGLLAVEGEGRMPSRGELQG